MHDTQTSRPFACVDIVLALGLLTRLPMRVGDKDFATRSAFAVWAYPLVGAVVGVLAAMIATTVYRLGVPAGIAAALALATMALITGAMHEDGLADSADGLGGGRDAKSSLSIMRESQIGAYGSVALTISLLARWSALLVLVQIQHLFWPLVVAATVSRLPMVLALYGLPPARAAGLASSVGRPKRSAVLGAIALAFAIAFFASGPGGFWIIFWAVVAPLPLFVLAQSKIGGHTGDILGASQQLAEIAALSVLVAQFV